MSDLIISGINRGAIGGKAAAIYAKGLMTSLFMEVTVAMGGQEARVLGPRAHHFARVITACQTAAAPSPGNPGVPNMQTCGAAARRIAAVTTAQALCQA